jgi:hypothetical protein
MGLLSGDVANTILQLKTTTISEATVGVSATVKRIEHLHTQSAMADLVTSNRTIECMNDKRTSSLGRVACSSCRCENKHRNS